MNTRATVLSAEGNTAFVRVFRKSACESCHACANKQACHAEIMLSEMPKNYEMVVENKIGAKTGDTVELVSNANITLLLAFLTFVFPFVASVAEYFLLNVFFTESVSLTVSVVSFLIFFVAFAVFSNKLSAKYVNVSISKILKENGI